LVNVALAVVFLGERLRPWQKGAITLAALGVVPMAWSAGGLPWISLALATSFGVYGLLRKVAPMASLVSLSIETALLGPIAAFYLVWLEAHGRSALSRGGPQTAGLLILAGIVTAFPLLWFACAAEWLRLSTLGLFQYLAPSGYFLLAVPGYGRALWHSPRRHLRVHLDGTGALLDRCAADSGLAAEGGSSPLRAAHPAFREWPAFVNGIVGLRWGEKVGGALMRNVADTRLLLLALALSAFSACKSQPQPVAKPVDVVVTEVVQQDVPITGEWVGTLEGQITAQIRARVTGYLQAQRYEEGRLVRQGDLLFLIDPRPYLAALEQAKGTLERQQALLRMSEINVARYEPLAKEGAVSQRELDNATQIRDANAGAVATAKANVDQAVLNLQWTKVESPIDGIAGAAQGQVGDLISENTILTTVSQLNPIRVAFPVSEREYLTLAGGLSQDLAGRSADTHVGATLEASEFRGKPGGLEMILTNGNTYPHRGTFIFVNRQVDERTGTLLIKGEFPNPGNLLRPGGYAKVRAVTSLKKGALLVPQRAVSELQGSYHVAVVDKDNKISIRSVEPGSRFENLWIIEKGLEPNERVVVEGLQKVKDGTVVNVQTAAPAESAPSAAGASPSSSRASG
jgi:membrane fusion protein (multidrug efflux system)